MHRPPALTQLERLVLDSDYDVMIGLDRACENVRVWLRAEVDHRLREVAVGERIEVACRNCGEPTDVSRSHAEKVTHGRVELPVCLDCRSPAKTAETDAEVVAFVEALGDQADGNAVALAALA